MYVHIQILMEYIDRNTSSFWLCFVLHCPHAGAAAMIDKELDVGLPRFGRDSDGPLGHPVSAC